MAGSTVHSAGGGAGHHDAPNAISIPFVVLTAILCGVGLFLIMTWFLTGNWAYFSGVFLVLVGAILMLSPRAGSDHA